MPSNEKTTRKKAANTKSLKIEKMSSPAGPIVWHDSKFGPKPRMSDRTLSRRIAKAREARAKLEAERRIPDREVWSEYLRTEPGSEEARLALDRILARA